MVPSILLSFVYALNPTLFFFTLDHQALSSRIMNVVQLKFHVSIRTLSALPRF